MCEEKRYVNAAKCEFKELKGDSCKLQDKFNFTDITDSEQSPDDAIWRRCTILIRTECSADVYINNNGRMFDVLVSVVNVFKRVCSISNPLFRGLTCDFFSSSVHFLC